MGDEGGGLEDGDGGGAAGEPLVEQRQGERAVAGGEPAQRLAADMFVLVARGGEQGGADRGRVRVLLRQEQGRPVAVRAVGIACQGDQPPQIRLAEGGTGQRHLVGDHRLQEIGRGFVGLGHGRRGGMRRLSPATRARKGRPCNSRPKS